MRGLSIRCAVWLLELLYPHDEAIIGDLVEGSRQHSVLWIWRQTVSTAVVQSSQIVFQGSYMKRVSTVTLVLLGVFLFGFWAGRSPLLMHRPESSRRDLFGVAEFLQQELAVARVDASREKTPESIHRVEDLEEKLMKALIEAKSGREQ